MTKKHYEAIAEVINNEIRPYGVNAVSQMTYDIIDGLCDYFQTDNPNFNRELFLEACGDKRNEPN